MIGATLERAGATVVAVASSRCAIEQIERSPPDLLISDIGMPDEDGYALIRRVRGLAASQGGAIPAIALTAYARCEDEERTVAAGYHRHVAKPIDPASLTEIAATVVRR